MVPVGAMVVIATFLTLSFAFLKDDSIQRGKTPFSLARSLDACQLSAWTKPMTFRASVTALSEL